MKLFKEILATATFRQSSVTFVGTVINGLLGLAFYGYVAQLLQPAQFGLFVLTTTALTLITDVSDFGTRTGLVRYVSKYLKDQREKSDKFLKFVLEFKIIVGLLITVLGWILAPIVAGDLLNKNELIVPLRIGLLGVIPISVLTFSLATIQAYQKFFIWSGLQVGTNLLRLIIIFMLVYIGSLNLINSLFVYILIPFLGFIASFLFIPKRFIFAKKEGMIANELFHYSKWIGAFVILAAISSRLDIFIVGKLLSTYEVGLYGIASQLAMIIPQIVVAVSTVIAPKMSEMGSKEELIEYYKKTQVLVIGLAILGLLAIPISFLVIPIFPGPAYIGAIPIFSMLLIAMLVFLVSIPIHNVIIYYFGYPKLFFWLSIGHLLIIISIGWMLTSRFGALGAASSVLIGTTFNFIIPLVWGLKKLRQ